MTGMNDSQITYLRLLGSNLFSRQKISEEEEDHESDENAEIPPQMAVGVVVRAGNVRVAEDGRGARDRADHGADLVRKGNVRVRGALRDKVGADRLQAVELVDD